MNSAQSMVYVLLPSVIFSGPHRKQKFISKGKVMSVCCDKLISIHFDYFFFQGLLVLVVNMNDSS